MIDGLKKKLDKMPTSLILVVGFGALIIFGAFLLNIPLATKNGRGMHYIDALFTATSAVCITGLSVFDPGSRLSLYGQIILLLLIQLGGLGFMSITSLIYSVLGKRISLKDRMLLSDSLNENKLQGVMRLTRDVFIVTFVSEGVGAILFSIRFIPMFGMVKGLFYSVFQAVSSFCNAGFDVFGLGNNLVPFVYDPLINIVTMLLIITGGLGFFVVAELYNKITRKSKKKLSFHTKIVLNMTAILILTGFLIFLAVESGNPKTLGARDIPATDKMLASLFQSVTTRTAGFATIPQQNLMPVSRLWTIFLMFIGASPAGTGGGIKTTTFAVVVLFVLSSVQGKKDVEWDRRTLPMQAVRRATAIFALGVFITLVCTAVIASLEQHDATLSQIAFEVTSAFGTVGLSTGITASLSAPSKLMLIFIMFGGRVGIFTFAAALSARMSKKRLNLHYPDGNIYIG